MPKSTAVTPVKPVPVIVTNVPPVSGPDVGLSTSHTRRRDSIFQRSSPKPVRRLTRERSPHDRSSR